MNNDVFVARMNKVAQFLSDGRDLSDAMAKRKRISKSRVKNFESYRLFFQALRSDPVFSRLADHSLRILDESIEYVDIYNTLGYVEELSRKATRIGNLLDEYDPIMDEIEREAGLNGV
ncbi:hypothetical protein HNQ85_000248 [Anoxybacillus calidus]|uniref:Uncharacterized protein n=1 Tax=[Anoxybacillus] calidus TaxID=575178 RepID=A0A7V9YXC7_9BACL|nr:hypothetical protein [Anoxybacillus calidus]MBA2869990.1 hypothetical protein [Anoxybacillus calidus]